MTMFYFVTFPVTRFGSVMFYVLNFEFPDVCRDEVFILDVLCHEVKEGAKPLRATPPTFGPSTR